MAYGNENTAKLFKALNPPKKRTAAKKDPATVAKGKKKIAQWRREQHLKSSVVGNIRGQKKK